MSGFRVTSESGSYGDKSVTIFETEIPVSEARFAMELVKRFGLIAAEPDGEDSNGRQKGKLMPVEEVVARSFDLARATFDAAREAGWMMKVPDLNEINAERDAKAKSKDTAAA